MQEGALPPALLGHDPTVTAVLVPTLLAVLHGSGVVHSVVAPVEAVLEVLLHALRVEGVADLVALDPAVFGAADCVVPASK